MSGSSAAWRDADRLVYAFAQDVGHSTKPIATRLGDREWEIPANFFGPKQHDEPVVFIADGYFGFVLFLPDFSGYTKENWQDPFDRNRIDVLQVSLVDKNVMVPLSVGGKQRVTPANYGEPVARFNNRERLLADQPALDLYGLKGYFWKSRRRSDVVWTGIRSNGEFFFFDSTMAPGAPLPRGLSFAHCKVQYYSEKEDTFIAYLYPQEHLPRWREIDDAIWARLHHWRVKR